MDHGRFQRTVDRIQALEPTTITGCHAPIVGEHLVTTALEATRQAPRATVQAQPDQAVLDAIVGALEPAA